MTIRAGILSQNGEVIESAKENVSFPLSRYHNFDYLKADEFDILLIDAEYFEGEDRFSSSSPAYANSRERPSSLSRKRR